MARTLLEAMPELCLSVPDAEQFVSHGAPNFRVRGGKTFAVLALNHHGDGRVALWLAAPDGAQSQLSQFQPQHYFVPPYVGVRGWVGVHLDQGLAWSEIFDRVSEAYRQVASHQQIASVTSETSIAEPDTALTIADIDPLQTPHARTVVEQLRHICLALPESSEGTQFGTPVWRAGKKAFALAWAYNGPLMLGFWVGIDRQSLMTADPRFSIPAYMGHNGWIALDVSDDIQWGEIKALATESYRHFALKRMLLALGDH